MMATTAYFLVGGAGVIALLCGIAWLLFRDYNSADAERRRRIAMQGPFVPLSEEDIAEDEARRRKL
jgi:hypothetical protein